MNGFIICGNEQRRAQLEDIKTFYSAGDWPSFVDFAEAVEWAKQNQPDRAIFHVTRDQGVASLQRLRTEIRCPIIVELERDEPATAFEFLKKGARYVVSAEATRIQLLWDKVLAMGRPLSEQIAGARIDVNLTQAPGRAWGFLSMAWDDDHRFEQTEYELAIRPAMEHLGVKLTNLQWDANPHDEVRRRIESALDDCSVLLAQISKPTLNTMYEIGFARGRNNKTIVLMRRDERGPASLRTGGKAGSSAGPPPATDNPYVSPRPPVLQGLNEIQYASLTDLALQLYFRLGGTHDRLMNSN